MVLEISSNGFSKCLKDRRRLAGQLRKFNIYSLKIIRILITFEKIKE